MTSPVLNVQKLSFARSPANQVLQEISFSIEPGERVALVGPNGAGKSTLLLHLNGLLPEQLPKTPQVWVGDLPVSREHLKTIRRNIGFLFQNTDDQLFCDQVGEDIAFGPQQLEATPQEVSTVVSEMLATLNIRHLANRRTTDLSQGEKRMVALAGVLACRPQFLALDEPTSDLDARSRRRFSEALLKTGLPMLVISHDLQWLRSFCSRVLLLDAGVLIADGPIDDILGNTALMNAHGLESPAL